jgi:hypothetical protein
MDFLKLLRSLEELLFEALSWLIFYPLTIWRVVTSPMAMMDYSNLEQADTLEEAYSDALSPGLFLIVTLLLVHGVELAMGINTDMRGALGEMATANDQNLLVTRSLMFGIYPLIFSVLLLVAKRQKLDRNQLRAPFFAQCYLTAMLALLFNGALFIIRLGTQEAAVFGLLSIIGVALLFIILEAFWLVRQAGIAWWRATLLSLLGFGVALVALSGASSSLS